MTGNVASTPEGRFLLDLARRWRSDPPEALPGQVDLERAVALAIHNRVAVLLARWLARGGLLEAVPRLAQERLAADVERRSGAAARLGDHLQRYLLRAEARGLETVVLKGLSLSSEIYGDVSIRPGGDIDVLVRREAVAACLETLDAIGVGAYWPNLLADGFYERHHLHQQRSTKDLRVWFEIHWALDHPYTTLTIDYEALMDRTRPSSLLGAPVRALDAADQLLSLAVHLVKHAIYLPSTVERPDLPSVILADGMLIYYLDVAEVVRARAADLDWEAVIHRAHAWGATASMGAVLQVARNWLAAPVPDEVLAALPVRGSGPVTRWAMQRMADQQLAGHQRGDQRLAWRLLTLTNGAFILRPIRMLDSVVYLLPDDEYLRRRYGRAGAGLRLRHLLRALAQFVRFAYDSLAYGMERHRRLRALRQSASLFNRLEAEP